LVSNSKLLREVKRLHDDNEKINERYNKLQENYDKLQDKYDNRYETFQNRNDKMILNMLFFLCLSFFIFCAYKENFYGAAASALVDVCLKIFDYYHNRYLLV